MITTAPSRATTREAALATAHEESTGPLEQFTYDDAIVRKFVLATLVWGLVATLVGVIIATQLAWPRLFGGIEWLSFGRLRPLHTNAAIFAFAGNAIFAAIYYSTQRLCKARMFSDTLGSLHFWGWQLIIVSAAATLLMPASSLTVVTSSFRSRTFQREPRPCR